MRISLRPIFISLSFLPLLSCQYRQNEIIEIDNNSYIKEFELIQENPSNLTTIRINSPRAIIDSTTNDLEIFDSNIKIINSNKGNVEITSGNSLLNNTNNLIKVYNNVNISLLDKNKSFIKTESFNWFLNSSEIDLNSPLDINFENTNIYSSYGIYNIDLRQLKLNKIIFNRNILNSEGKPMYNINIISDNLKWLKDNNSLEFSSTSDQVISTIDFLSSKEIE